MATPPAWLALFGNRIAQHMHAIDMLAPIGCHFQLEEQIWVVTLFCSSTEIVGGERDGESTYSRFSLDVQAVASEFEQVEAIEWQNDPEGDLDDLGTHIGIMGQLEGTRIWLRILSKPPRGMRSGRIAHLKDEKFIELW